MEPAQVNVAAAALVAQFGYLVILVIGMSVLNPRVIGHRLVWVIVAIIVFSLGLLILSTPVTDLSRPLFRDIPLPTMSFADALSIVFIVDLSGTWLIVRLTGGSRGSPFTPLLGLIPTLAMFLRTPFSMVIFCAGAIVIYMCFELIGTRVLTFYPSRPPIQSEDRIATSNLLVATLSLVLTVMVGYVTQPLR